MSFLKKSDGVGAVLASLVSVFSSVSFAQDDVLPYVSGQTADQVAAVEARSSAPEGKTWSMSGETQSKGGECSTVLIDTAAARLFLKNTLGIDSYMHDMVTDGMPKRVQNEIQKEAVGQKAFLETLFGCHQNSRTALRNMAESLLRNPGDVTTMDQIAMSALKDHYVDATRFYTKEKFLTLADEVLDNEKAHGRAGIDFEDIRADLHSYIDRGYEHFVKLALVDDLQTIFQTQVSFPQAGTSFTQIIQGAIDDVLRAQEPSGDILNVPDRTQEYYEGHKTFISF